MKKYLCEYGCGQEAKYQLKNGKWCCSEKYQSCPQLKKRNSLSNKNKQPWNKGLTKESDDRILKISNKNKTHSSWNKGLTKESDDRIKKFSIKIKNMFKNGDLIPSFLGKKHKKESIEKIKKAQTGGYHKNGGKGKRGWYKGYYCDSSWELAYVIYNLEHNIKFERNTRGFEYEYLGKKYKFYPDFILEDGTFVEIKGYLDEKNKIKINSFQGHLKVLGKNEIKFYLDYVIQKYGKLFVSLYE